MSTIPGTGSDTLAGIHPILYAFFNADGTLDRGAMRRQVDALIAMGAHGIAVLGLATEVRSLTPAERRMLMDWTAEDVGGRVPLAVTIFEPTAEAQIAAARHARSVGADWLILQPPPGGGTPEDDLVNFFSTVGSALDLPFAIQNAPEYLGVGLTAPGLRTLASRCPRFRLLKGEASAVAIAALIRETGGRLTVFNGRGGLEIVDNLAAGCAGIIPAPDVADRLIGIHAAFAAGDEHGARERYAEILPVIVFVMQSIDSLLIYGKLLAARRLGLRPPVQRNPALKPTAFGLTCLDRWTSQLGRFE